ncbi:hypothetical protein OAB01_02345 [Bacteroidia bacterium]|nr:hypothetical protein [Bacteroidia bacterium]
MRKSFTILCTFLFIMHLGASELSPLYYNPFKKEFRQSQFEPDPRHKEKTDWKEKVTFGGTMSVNFGTFTFVLLNPQIIYKINETTWLGAGPYYQYLRQNIGGSILSSSIYGATAFGRKYITTDLFLQAEYNQLFLKNSSGGRTGQGYGMAGGGYQPHPNFYLMAMYIFTQDPGGYAPYGGVPWVIRGGIIL